jgi:hypothetical protein
VIEGQDLGPSTAPVSGDGEYEWSFTFEPEALPALSAALGATEEEDILQLLERDYTGSGSYELERIIRETESSVPRRFSAWSG